MIEKKYLLNILNDDGQCYNNDFCEYCPIKTFCFRNYNITPETKLSYYKMKKEVALRYYLKVYGKDSELMEVLL